MKALIIVDMLNDFVDGELANPRAQRIVEPLQRLLAHARENGWVVVFSNDAHHPDDPELKVWGEHAMAGTPGAQVIPRSSRIPASASSSRDKRGYGAFDGTGLDEQLKALGVDEVVITGQHTHICVRHSSYGALARLRDRGPARRASAPSRAWTRTRRSPTSTERTRPGSPTWTSSSTSRPRSGPSAHGAGGDSPRRQRRGRRCARARSHAPAAIGHP